MKRLTLLAALLLTACASQETSIVLANRHRAERRPALLRQANAVRLLAADSCRAQLAEREKTYVRPANCPTCSAGDNLMLRVDMLWSDAVTGKWYTGHEREWAHLDMRTALVGLFGDGAVVAAIDRVAPRAGERVREGSAASVLVTEASEACRAVAAGAAVSTVGSEGER